MTYKVEIPQELRPQIIKVFDSLRGRMYMRQDVGLFLMRVYCRFVEPITEGGKYQKLEDKVKKYLNCPDCRNRMYNYFEQEIDKWENPEWYNEGNTTTSK